MDNKLDDRYFYICGWEHFWCDPKNFKNYKVRELIKGPFSNPKIVYSIPYITFYQLNDTSIRLSEGIPDCWAECLTNKLRFFRKYLLKNDLMHKECLDIIPQLRKKYRLYIGQGIPNPWISYSCIDEPEIVLPVLPRNLSMKSKEKYLCHLLHCEDLKKELCICCKKKYLFECPDDCDTDSEFCLHKNYHCKNTKVTDYGKNCKCIEFLKSTISKQNKKQIQEGSSESNVSTSNNSDLGAGDKDQNIKENKRSQNCECIRIQKAYNDNSVGEKLFDERQFKPNNRNNVQSKNQSNVCFCPCIKSFYLRRVPQKNNFDKNFLEPKSASKLIQTEILPIKISKTSQTENLESKTQNKCTGNNKKFVQYYTCQCKTPWLKSSRPAAHSISCLCFPLSCPQSPAVICPCFFPNNFLHHNFIKHKSKTRKLRIKKKQHKDKETDDESNVRFKVNQNAHKRDEKYEFKEPRLLKINDDDLKSNKNVYYLSEYPKTFNHLKYVTDEKPKYYLQQEEISSSLLNNKVNYPSSYSGSGLINFRKGDSLLYDLRPEKFGLKTYSNNKPRHFEFSFVDSKTNFQENNIKHNARRFNYSDQASMTKTSNNDSATKDTFVKEKVNCDKSRTYGLAKSRIFSTKAIKKRKRLLVNRDRRKKLADSEKISFLEY